MRDTSPTDPSTSNRRLTSAEEVALTLVGSIEVLSTRNEWKRLTSLIEIALMDYAEERIAQMAEGRVSREQDIRAEALEEAAKLFESRPDVTYLPHYAAELLRALKEKP